MTSVTASFRQDTGRQALKLLQDAAPRQADKGARPIWVDDPAVAAIPKNQTQQAAIARVSKLLLEGSFFSESFLFVKPTNASVVEGSSRSDVVSVVKTGDDLDLNYISLGDGDDRLTLVSDGDATADYWQGRAAFVGNAMSDAVNAEIAVYVPDGQGIFAGAGNDTVSIAAGRDVHSVSGNEGDDAIAIAAGRDVSGVWGGVGRDVVTIAAGNDVDNVTGDAGDDMLTIAAGNEARSIWGGSGDDVINIAAGSTVSSIGGGSGNDVINIASAALVTDVSGDDGDDVISITGASVKYVDGGLGDDFIAINAQTAGAISGGRGNDTLDLTGTDKASIFFDRGDGQDVVHLAGETRITFADRNLDDAEISYGDGTITISFGDNGDSVTLDYSRAALKGSEPDLAFAGARGSQVSDLRPGYGSEPPYFRFYADHSGDMGFTLTVS